MRILGRLADGIRIVGATVALLLWRLADIVDTPEDAGPFDVDELPAEDGGDGADVEWPGAVPMADVAPHLDVERREAVEAAHATRLARLRVDADRRNAEWERRSRRRG